MNEASPTLAVLGGTGAEGQGLALRFARAGYRVVVGSRSSERADAAVDRIRTKNAGARVEAAINAEAAAAGSIVFLTVPYAAQIPTALEVREALSGKILVDATVPLVPPRVTRVQMPEEGSAASALQAALGPEVKVVSAFQNVSAHHLQDGDSAIDCDVLVCGDDVEARDTVIELARAIGLKAWHAGPLANSAVAEGLTSILIAINKRYKVAGAGIRITGVDDS